MWSVIESKSGRERILAHITVPSMALLVSPSAADHLRLPPPVSDDRQDADRKFISVFVRKA